MRRLIAVLVVLCLAPLALLTWFSVSLSAKAVRGQVDAKVRNTAAARRDGEAITFNLKELRPAPGSRSPPSSTRTAG